jgi:hypothetical protein
MTGQIVLGGRVLSEGTTGVTYKSQRGPAPLFEKMRTAPINPASQVPGYSRSVRTWESCVPDGNGGLRPAGAIGS